MPSLRKNLVSIVKSVRGGSSVSRTSPKPSLCGGSSQIDDNTRPVDPARLPSAEQVLKWAASSTSSSGSSSKISSNSDGSSKSAAQETLCIARLRLALILEEGHPLVARIDDDGSLKPFVPQAAEDRQYDKSRRWPNPGPSPLTSYRMWRARRSISTTTKFSSTSELRRVRKSNASKAPKWADGLERKYRYIRKHRDKGKRSPLKSEVRYSKEQMDSLMNMCSSSLPSSSSIAREESSPKSEDKYEVEEDEDEDDKDGENEDIFKMDDMDLIDDTEQEDEESEEG
jgi:hypothetical protein